MEKPPTTAIESQPLPATSQRRESPWLAAVIVLSPLVLMMLLLLFLFFAR